MKVLTEKDKCLFFLMSKFNSCCIKRKKKREKLGGKDQRFKVFLANNFYLISFSVCFGRENCIWGKNKVNVILMA